MGHLSMSILSAALLSLFLAACGQSDTNSSSKQVGEKTLPSAKLSTYNPTISIYNSNHEQVVAIECQDPEGSVQASFNTFKYVQQSISAVFAPENQPQPAIMK